MIPVGAVLIAAAVARLVYVTRLGGYIEGDEAVVGIMALKIAAGEEFPLLMWEAHYGGTLTSYLGAVLFRLLDPSPLALRAATLPIGLIGIGAVTATAHRLWGGGPALVAGAWLVAGPPLLVMLSGQAIGGYPETFCFSALMLWLGARLGRAPATEAGSARDWILLGAAGGFGIYGHALVLPVLAGVVWALGRHRGSLTRRELWPLGAGLLAGLAPLLVHNVIHPGASALRLAGRVFDVSRGDVDAAASAWWLATDVGQRYLLRLVTFPERVLANVPVLLGLDGPGAGPIVVIAAAIALVAYLRYAPRAGLAAALLGWSSVSTLVFLWILRLDLPRHLFPFYALVPLGLAGLWARSTRRWRILVCVALALWLGANVSRSLRDAAAVDRGMDALVDALEARHLTAVYTDYWIAYPLMFLSGERILASPAAGPANVDRHPPTSRAVAASARPVYVFRRETEASAVFVREMRRHGLAFATDTIGGFDLYVPERHVRPGELALVRQF